MLRDPAVLRAVVEHFADCCRDEGGCGGGDRVARVYVCGASALVPGAGFVPVRKLGKLPPSRPTEYALGMAPTPWRCIGYPAGDRDHRRSDQTTARRCRSIVEQLGAGLPPAVPRRACGAEGPRVCRAMKTVSSRSNRKIDAPLEERKQRILRAVVRDYVETAEPVGSEALAERYDFGVKSATLRNEMAEMAEQGYLQQPHTSAGRIPSDKGYRYYVDWLIAPAPQCIPAPTMRTELIGHAVVESILHQTCRMLSALTSYVSIATPALEEDVCARCIWQ